MISGIANYCLVLQYTHTFLSTRCFNSVLKSLDSSGYSYLLFRVHNYSQSEKRETEHTGLYMYSNITDRRKTFSRLDVFFSAQQSILFLHARRKLY